ncbi:MAG: L,D-transpeptidase [Candidatus Caenarcaniphilales bacterium]|nr:L,D-transpeptidase [Candidatus Caenarcaniphilales bacterium]
MKTKSLVKSIIKSKVAIAVSKLFSAKLFLCFLFCIVFCLPTFAIVRKEIRINVPSRTLQFLQSGRLVREYSVGVGNSKVMQTPPGRYKVERKIINPIWEHPYKAPGQSRIGNGAKNPLGTRWIGFHSEGSGVYGIHGTNEPSSIGRFVSHGCVRMHNADVEELFELAEQNTPVLVTYDRFDLNKAGNTITLEVFPDPYGMKKLTVEEIVEEVRQIDRFAVIDFDMVSQAITDNSESSIYEVAHIDYNYQRAYPPQQSVPFSDPYSRPQYQPYAYPPFSQAPQAMPQAQIYSYPTYPQPVYPSTPIY